MGERIKSPFVVEGSFLVSKTGSAIDASFVSAIQSSVLEGTPLSVSIQLLVDGLWMDLAVALSSLEEVQPLLQLVRLQT